MGTLGVPMEESRFCDFGFTQGGDGWVSSRSSSKFVSAQFEHKATLPVQARLLK